MPSRFVLLKLRWWFSFFETFGLVDILRHLTFDIYNFVAKEVFLTFKISTFEFVTHWLADLSLDFVERTQSDSEFFLCTEPFSIL